MTGNETSYENALRERSSYITPRALVTLASSFSPTTTHAQLVRQGACATDETLQLGRMGFSPAVFFVLHDVDGLRECLRKNTQVVDT